MRTFLTLLPALSLLHTAYAATAEQWRGRSIYQVIVDRFALPKGADPNKCDPGAQTWCGGTWNALRENLDYIQDMGFTAVWISPVNQNYEGPRTAYGDAYHGYWIMDHSQLNSKFGTAEDLKALSDELHRRGMYLMVDVVVNDVMSPTLEPDYSKYMFKDESQYHPYCPIQWGNITSEQDCWLGDTNVPLPDLNTEDPTVVAGLNSWVKDMVDTYAIDGLRIDAAKHVSPGFWPSFCGAAGVFCIGEVFGSDIDQAASYQSDKELDAILNYPMYTALMDAFAIPGDLNTSAITATLDAYKTKFKDPGLLGNFLENQDLPRWANVSVDPQSMYNAMTFNFMSDGIPIVYYGQEQGFKGNADPWNREALWPSQYQNTSASGIITKLNTFRNFLVNNTSSDWLHKPTEVLTTDAHGIAIMKGDVLSVLTNIGSPPANVSMAVYTPYSNSLAMTDVLSCAQYVIGSNGTLSVEYTKGGQAKVIVPSTLLQNSGICGNPAEVDQKPKGQLADGSAAGRSLSEPHSLAGGLVFSFVLFVLGFGGFLGHVV
ncbi:alpha-amylase [Cristinia sonorae]|uniref:alpha-amylase n=1 Tax=Cristinia sonorae TaxID=1940300 RepID=A0A8K0XSC0_9AGAR|nr:alpha-amylase [Cristinia sonorae]